MISQFDGHDIRHSRFNRGSRKSCLIRNMYRFACLLVLCVCASVGVCRDIMRTSADLGDAASDLAARAAIEKSNMMTNLDLFEYYKPLISTSGTLVKLKRFKRNFIGTDNCSKNQVRLLGVCVSCAQ